MTITCKPIPTVTRTGRYIRFRNQLTNKPTDIGFSETNEKTVGRLAMLGVVAVGLDAMALGTLDPAIQLERLTGLDLSDIQFLIAGIAAISAATAFSYAPMKYDSARHDGPIQDPRITLFQPLAFLGVDEFGLNDSVEVFHGRLAMLFMVASIFQ